SVLFPILRRQRESTLFPYTTLFRSENDGEYIRVAKPDQGNTDINHRLVLKNEQPEHGGQHTQHTDSEEGFSRHLLQNESSQKTRSEEHTSELQSRFELVCRLLLEKK